MHKETNSREKPDKQTEKVPTETTYATQSTTAHAFAELLQGVGQLVGCCRDKAFTCEFYLIQARHMEPFI